MALMSSSDRKLICGYGNEVNIHVRVWVCLSVYLLFTPYYANKILQVSSCRGLVRYRHYAKCSSYIIWTLLIKLIILHTYLYGLPFIMYITYHCLDKLKEMHCGILSLCFKWVFPSISIYCFQFKIVVLT